MRGFLLLLWMPWLAQAVSYYEGAPSRFSLSDLEAMLKSQQPPRTMEQVFTKIQDHSPRMFENFVLMYRSKSFQASSNTHPRAIVYNEDASFVMTFNGHPSQRGYDKLEVMQYLPETHRFEFREVSFSGGRAQLSPPNPKLCMSCHQASHRTTPDPRPNWEPYSRWPGAIGSEQGRFNPHMQSEIYRPDDAIHMQEAAREEQILQEFLAQQPEKHPRYRFLRFPDKQDRLFQMATSLTDLLGRLNFYRVMRLAESDAPEHFAKIKHVLAGAARCGRFYAPTGVVSVIELETPLETDNFVIRNGSMMRQRLRMPITKPVHDGIGGESFMETFTPEPYPSLAISEALYLLYEPFGIDISDWSMDFRTNGRLAFQERFGLPSNPNQAADEAFEKVHPSLSEFSCHRPHPTAIEQGSQLLSLPVRPRPAVKPLIDSCIRCHSDTRGDAPLIPFDNPAAFRLSLTNYKTKSGKPLLEDIIYRMSDHATLDEQMPKSLNRPSPESRKALIKYLQGLGADPTS